MVGLVKDLVEAIADTKTRREADYLAPKPTVLKVEEGAMVFITVGYKRSVRFDAISCIEEGAGPHGTVVTTIHLDGTTIELEGRHHDRLLELMTSVPAQLRQCP